MKTFITRSVLINLVGLPLLLIYMMINQRTGIEHRLVKMPEWVPFYPLMSIPYLLMLFVPWLGTLFLKNQRHFYQYLVSVSLAFLVIASIWYFFPTEMTRPVTHEGSLYEIHRILVAHDNPVCIVPCGHVMGPIAIVFLLYRERPKWILWMLPLLALGLISIATTFQHRPIDIVTGSIVTLTAVYATRRVFTKFEEVQNLRASS